MTLDNGAMRMALPWDFIEGIAVTTDIFASDNETGEKRTVNYRPVFRQNTYKLESLPWQTFSIADVGKFFQLAIWSDGTQYADHASASPVSWQFRLEWVIDDLGQFVEVRFVPTTGYQPAIVWAPANVISYNNPICWTPVANVQDALDEITAILCPTANLAHVPATITSPSGSITTWASGTDSQTLEVDVNIARLQGQVSAMETQTTLDQVDIISSGNIITSTVYYTWENGNPQAQSDSTTIINTWNFLPTPTGLKIEINGVTIGEVPRSAISPNITIDTNDTLNISPNWVGDLILTFTDDSNSNNDQQTFNLTQYFWVQTTTDANGVTTITQNWVPLATIHSHTNGNGTTVQNNPNWTIAINLAYDNDLKIVNGKLGIGANLVRDTTTALSGYKRERIGSWAITEIEPYWSIKVSTLAWDKWVIHTPHRISFFDTNQADDPSSEIRHVNGDLRYKSDGGHFFFCDQDADSASENQLAYSFAVNNWSFNPWLSYIMTMLQIWQVRIWYQWASTALPSPTWNGAILYIRANNGLKDTVIESTTANYSWLVTKNMTSATPSTAWAKAVWVDADWLFVTIDSAPAWPTAPVSWWWTSSVSNPASDGADLTSTCTFTNWGDPITDQGRVVYPWWTWPADPWAIIFSTTADPFTVTWLSPSTNYCAVPYATNSIGTSYCDEICFTTASAPLLPEWIMSLRSGSTTFLYKTPPVDSESQFPSLWLTYISAVDWVIDWWMFISYNSSSKKVYEFDIATETKTRDSNPWVDMRWRMTQIWNDYFLWWGDQDIYKVDKATFTLTTVGQYSNTYISSASWVISDRANWLYAFVNTPNFSSVAKISPITAQVATVYNHTPSFSDLGSDMEYFWGKLYVTYASWVKRLNPNTLAVEATLPLPWARWMARDGTHLYVVQSWPKVLTKVNVSWAMSVVGSVTVASTWQTPTDAMYHTTTWKIYCWNSEITPATMTASTIALTSWRHRLLQIG